MTGDTEWPAPPLTHDQLEALILASEQGGFSSGGATVRLLLDRALAELRTRRAAEEAHRRSAENFEERARDWLKKRMVFAATEEAATESLASLLAAVHSDAMETAAGVVHE